MRRMECAAGEEAQVDFGSGAPVVGADGKRRKTHVFRIVLSHSRKAYSEATFRQTTEDFIGCLENAFASFGGVPKILVIDNLRAAVKHPDWFDPELVPKLRSFCQHYGVVILPTKPYTPRHKGKVEARHGVRAKQRAERADSSPGFRSRTSTWPAGRRRSPTRGSTAPRGSTSARSFAKWSGLPCSRCRSSGSRCSRKRSGRSVATGTSRWPRPITRCRRSIWDARYGCAGTHDLVRVFNQRFEQIAMHRTT